MPNEAAWDYANPMTNIGNLQMPLVLLLLLIMYWGIKIF